MVLITSLCESGALIVDLLNAPTSENDWIFKLEGTSVGHVTKVLYLLYGSSLSYLPFIISILL